MKNGCKSFSSPTMDKLKIEPYFQNRLDDITFAQIKLRQLNHRGSYIEDTMMLIDELHQYIWYLYEHIEQLEKDKQYLNIERIKK